LPIFISSTANSETDLLDLAKALAERIWRASDIAVAVTAVDKQRSGVDALLPAYGLNARAHGDFQGKDPARRDNMEKTRPERPAGAREVTQYVVWTCRVDSARLCLSLSRCISACAIASLVSTSRFPISQE
jgi:hypothetical protein